MDFCKLLTELQACHANITAEMRNLAYLIRYMLTLLSYYQYHKPTWLPRDLSG